MWLNGSTSFGMTSNTEEDSIRFDIPKEERNRSTCIYEYIRENQRDVSVGNVVFVLPILGRGRFKL